MWDDVVIGKGEHLCSSVKIYEGPDTRVYISENRNSYWISDLFIGGSMKIFKDTVQGKHLTELLEKVKTKGEIEYKISDFLNRLYLKRVNPLTLMEIIKTRMEESYNSGKEMKADEIRRVLGIFN